MALKLLCPQCGGVLRLFSPSGNGDVACDSCQVYYWEEELDQATREVGRLPADPVARSHQWDRKAGPTFCDSPWGHGVRCGEPLIGACCKACGVVNRFGGPDLPSSCSGVERLTEAKMARSCGADVDGRWPNGFPYRPSR